MKIILRTWSSILNEYMEKELPIDLIEGEYADFPIGFTDDHINVIRIYKKGEQL